jgi:hypothetical protein
MPAAPQSVPMRSGTIRFSGYNWTVKTSSGQKVGPGPNYFGDEAIEVVPEGLKIRVVEQDGRYLCGEIVSKQSFGYGTYRFTLASNIDNLAPNLVLGLFTWSDDPEYDHRELDVEISKWGDPDNDNAQFVVQPYNAPDHLIRFSIPAGLAVSTYEFTWAPGRVDFRAEGPKSATIKTQTFTRRVPAEGGENARINLWLVSGRPPQSGSKEIIISKFEFLPLDKK